MDYFRRVVLESDQIERFGMVKAMVPDLLRDEKATCHSICAYLAWYFPFNFTHVKGLFGTMDHSWLVFKQAPNLILDPYPVACLGGPILVDTGTNLVFPTGWASLYRKIPAEDIVEAEEKILKVLGVP